MKWIIAIFLILDSIYQLFGNPFTDFWQYYYDFIHYSVLLSISVYFLINTINKIYYVFSAYFVVVLFSIIYDSICVENLTINPVYISSLAALLILITFTLCQKLKKTGK